MGEKTECGVRNAESVFKIFLHTWWGFETDSVFSTLWGHHKDIAHPDLKPENVLISNQHYCNIKEEQWAGFEKEPICLACVSHHTR